MKVGEKVIITSPDFFEDPYIQYGIIISTEDLQLFNGLRVNHTIVELDNGKTCLLENGKLHNKPEFTVYSYKGSK